MVISFEPVWLKLNLELTKPHKTQEAKYFSSSKSFKDIITRVLIKI